MPSLGGCRVFGAMSSLSLRQGSRMGRMQGSLMILSGETYSTRECCTVEEYQGVRMFDTIGWNELFGVHLIDEKGEVSRRVFLVVTTNEEDLSLVLGFL